MHSLSWHRIWDKIPLCIHEWILSFLTPIDMLSMRVSKRTNESIKIYVLLHAYKHIKINLYPLLSQLHMTKHNKSKPLDKISIGINHIMVYSNMNVMFRGNDYYGQLGNHERNLSYNNRGINHIYYDKVIRQVEAGTYYYYYHYY